MDFKELIEKFAAEAGMTEPVRFDEDGVCHLDIEDMDVGFMDVPERSQMVVWTAICHCPSEGGEALMRQLLKANFIGRGLADGALSLSDDDDIYAHFHFHLPEFEPVNFYRSLRTFLDTVGEWRTLIENYRRLDDAVKTVRATRPSEDAREEIRIEG